MVKRNSPSEPQIVTANRLRDGAVVYWMAGGWVLSLAEAQIFADADGAEAALAGAAAAVAARAVVNPYAFAVRLEHGIAVPLSEREIIRASGPSVHRDLGKQADPVLNPRFATGPTPARPQPRLARGKEAFDVSL